MQPAALWSLSIVRAAHCRMFWWWTKSNWIGRSAWVCWRIWCVAWNICIHHSCGCTARYRRGIVSSMPDGCLRSPTMDCINSTRRKVFKHHRKLLNVRNIAYLIRNGGFERRSPAPFIDLLLIWMAFQFVHRTVVDSTGIVAKPKGFDEVRYTAGRCVFLWHHHAGGGGSWWTILHAVIVGWWNYCENQETTAAHSTEYIEGGRTTGSH